MLIIYSVHYFNGVTTTYYTEDQLSVGHLNANKEIKLSILTIYLDEFLMTLFATFPTWLVFCQMIKIDAYNILNIFINS